MKFTLKLNAAPAASFHVLDPEKAKRMNGKTLYIPSVEDVIGVIRSIPKGEMRTIPQLRAQLAKQGGADVSCPAATIKYWKWLAYAAEYEKGDDLPWWRVTKDGKPSHLLPGGKAAHVHKLESERKT